jgi:uncharacterized protein (TIGR00369 family)
MSELPENVVDMINARLGGFNEAMGVHFVSIEANEIVAELKASEQHLQPYGLVHGGVFTALIETLCSVGAALAVMPEGKTAVGLENTTSFLRAVRSGTIRGTARPLSQGRRSHVWQAEVRDQEDRLVASGRVRMLILEPGAEAAGEEVRLEHPVSQQSEKSEK